MHMSYIASRTVGSYRERQAHLGLFLCRSQQLLDRLGCGGLLLCQACPSPFKVLKGLVPLQQCAAEVPRQAAASLFVAAASALSEACSSAIESPQQCCPQAVRVLAGRQAILHQQALQDPSPVPPVSAVGCRGP